MINPMFRQDFVRITKKNQKNKNLYKTDLRLGKTINFGIEFWFQLVF